MSAPIFSPAFPLPRILDPEIIGTSANLEPIFAQFLNFVQSRTLTLDQGWDKLTTLNWEETYYSKTRRALPNTYYRVLAQLQGWYDVRPECPLRQFRPGATHCLNQQGCGQKESPCQFPAWEVYLNTVTIFCSLHYGRFIPLTEAEQKICRDLFDEGDSSIIADSIHAVLGEIQTCLTA